MEPLLYFNYETLFQNNIDRPKHTLYDFKYQEAMSIPDKKF